MIFSSAPFLFAFLPCAVIVYYLLRGRTARNVFLTLASLFFYAWGEPWFALVMLVSILANWFVALRIDAGKHRKGWMCAGVVFDLGLLGVFKYLTFILRNVNGGFGLSLPVPQIALPIGISFFTFQAISYIVDVYRGDGRVQKNFMNVCLYISFFPQLIAGPIVRYQTFDNQIGNRRESLDDFFAGVRRFMLGLSKKVLLANNLAALVDTAFAMEASALSTAATWMAAAAYLLQVYYDFSGYSDMAIGLAKMFGFDLLENFNLPFISRSVTEFWRRWHISLATWFRDYLYIPLGGSRVKLPRLVFNMFMVWTLTGLWHGAEWTYALWGFLFFVFLAFERFTGAGKWLGKHWLGHIYMCVVVTTITVLIRSVDMAQAMEMFRSMFALDGSLLFDDTARMFIREYGVFLAASFVCALPVPRRIPEPVRAIGLAACTFAALTYVVMGSYNPFIYFNF